jgi:hypothetical protein
VNAVGILLVQIIRDDLEFLLQRQIEVSPADLLQDIRIEDMSHAFLPGQSLPNPSPHLTLWQGVLRPHCFRRTMILVTLMGVKESRLENIECH